MNNDTIAFPKIFAPQIKEFYENQIHLHESKINELRSLLVNLNQTPSVQNKGETPAQNKIKYMKGSSMRLKAIAILNEGVSPLSLVEIIDKIAEHEPNIDKGKTRSTLSSVLSAHSRPGKCFHRIKSESGIYVYENSK